MERKKKSTKNTCDGGGLILFPNRLPSAPTKQASYFEEKSTEEKGERHEGAKGRGEEGEVWGSRSIYLCIVVVWQKGIEM